MIQKVSTVSKEFIRKIIMRTQAADTLFSYYLLSGDVHAALTKHAENCLPSNLTMAQFQLLDFLRNNQEPITPLTLAGKFKLTKGAVTNLIKQLNRKGFLQIEQNTLDKRSKFVKITENGMIAHRNSMIAMSEMTTSLLLEFSSKELQACFPVLEKLKKWLERSQ